MEFEGRSLLRVRPVVNKGKGLASGVHLFREIHKKPRKKRSNVHLKNISNVIVKSRSISTYTPFASTAAVEV